MAMARNCSCAGLGCSLMKYVHFYEAAHVSRLEPVRQENIDLVQDQGIQNTHSTFKRFNARKAGAYALMFFLFLFDAGSLKAQTPDPTPLNAPQPGVRPPLTPFPRYEDWSFLRDPALRVDPYDRLKFIPLNDSETNYLTFGLESRTEFQYLGNNNWGAGPQNPAVLLERLMPYVDLRLGDHARVFVTVAFSEFTGPNPRPEIDKNIADGHEGFVEFGGNLHDPHPGWDVIAGRQEIVLGTGRLLDDNEGVNVRSAFDGFRVGYDKPKGRIDLIAVKPVEINPGAWDDITNPAITLWGLYASNLLWEHALHVRCLLSRLRCEVGDIRQPIRTRAAPHDWRTVFQSSAWQAAQGRL